MDLSSLPYETQFRFLLSLPPGSVANYCNVNTTAAAICRTTAFWNLKSKKDFGITFDMIPGDLTLTDKYDLASNKEFLLNYLFENKQLDNIPYILSLMRTEAITDVELVKYKVIAVSIISRIVNQEDDDTTAAIIKQIVLPLVVFTGDEAIFSMTTEILSHLRNAYFRAVLNNMDKTVAALSMHYNWRFDITSWTLSQWIKQWYRIGNPELLAKLAKVGLVPTNLVE